MHVGVYVELEFVSPPLIMARPRDPVCAGACGMGDEAGCKVRMVAGLGNMWAAQPLGQALLCMYAYFVHDVCSSAYTWSAACMLD